MRLREKAVIGALTAAVICGTSITAFARDYRTPMAEGSDMVQAALYPQADGNINPVFIEYAHSYLSLIPDDILTALEEEGWTFSVTDKNIDETYFDGKYGSVAGVTITEERRILVEDRESSIYIAVAHEVGHAVDAMIGYGSLSDDFASVMPEAPNLIISCYGRAKTYPNNMEYFAEAFSEYILNPEAMKANCPGTYSQMEKMIGKFRSQRMDRLHAAAGRGWYRGDQGDWYYSKNGRLVKEDWECINDDYYYFDQYGKMYTGWLDVKSGKYYCDESGAWQRGCKKEIDGVWYTFGSDGIAAACRS